MQDLELVYFATCTTCEITTRIFKGYFRVFYPCCTQEESSRLWKVDLPRVYNTWRVCELIAWIINQFSIMLISLKTCVLFVGFPCWGVSIAPNPWGNSPPPQNLGNSQTSPFSNLISILHVTAESLFTPLKHDKLNKVAVKSFLNKRKRLKKQLKHIRKYVTLFQLWRISQNKAEIPVKWILVVFEAFPYGEA